MAAAEETARFEIALTSHYTDTRAVFLEPHTIRLAGLDAAQQPVRLAPIAGLFRGTGVDSRLKTRVDIRVERLVGTQVQEG